MRMKTFFARKNFRGGETSAMLEQIIILDFGSQYTQVIARRIRECNVYSQILRFDTPAAEIARNSSRAESFCPAGRRAFMRRTRRCRIKIFSNSACQF
jgi:hypothetical protein